MEPLRCIALTAALLAFQTATAAEKVCFNVPRDVPSRLVYTGPLDQNYRICNGSNGAPESNLVVVVNGTEVETLPFRMQQPQCVDVAGRRIEVKKVTPAYDMHFCQQNLSAP